LNQSNRKKNNHQEYACIAIIGLGYVGLPLAIEFGKKYKTIGFDINKKRVEALKQGIDITQEVENDGFRDAKKLSFTNKAINIARCNYFIITVPTPIDRFNTPDLSHLLSASKAVGKVLKLGDIVIYESTVYPGATEEICVPMLEKVSGLKYNVDFFCGYSPERINPGDKEHSLTTINKVTSGSNNVTANMINELYESIIPAGTHQASSIMVAEAAKVIENIQRDVNIALINELSMIFDKLDIDTNEVLETAASKWNFLHFRPGLVGGHCIGVDPYYMTHKATEIGFNPEMILAGRRINDGMGKFIADITISELAKAGTNPIGAKVAVFGLTFKENCPDLRNTKVINVINNLIKYNCNVIVTDCFADKNEAKNTYNTHLVELNQIDEVDAVILAVAHDQYKSISVDIWQNILKQNGVFIDVKSMLTQDYFTGISINHWRL